MTTNASRNKIEVSSTSVVATSYMTDKESGSTYRSDQGKRVIFILGMHRSGTSALTRTLGLLGASLPKTLLPASADNPTGFWESSELVALHDSILASAGSHWHDVGNIPDSWFASEDAAEFRARARDLFASEFPKARLPIIKDPRVCRLVPFWVATLAEMDMSPLFVFALRNPMEISASLMSRNDFTLAKTILLWLKHILQAERDTRGLPRSFILYDNLMLDWRLEIERIGRELSLNWPRRSFNTEAEIDNFLSPRLRHHTVGTANFERQSQIPAWAKLAHRSLLAGAEGGDPDIATLDRIAQELLNAEGTFGPLIASLERDLSTVSSTVISLRSEITKGDDGTARLTGAVSAAEEKVTSLQQQLQESSLRISELESGLQEREARTSELSQALAEHEGFVGQLQQAVADRDGVVERLEQAVTERDGQMANLRTVIVNQDETVASLHQALSERETIAIEFRNSLAERDGMLAELERIKAEREAEAASLRSALGERDDDLDTSRGIISEREAQVRMLEQSIAERDLKIADAEAALVSQVDQIAEQSASLAALDEELKSLHAEMEERDREIAEARSGMDRQAADLQTLQTSVAELNAEISTLQRSLQSRERELDDLGHAHDGLSASLDEMRTKGDESSATISRLRQTLAQADDERDALRKSLTEVLLSTGERERRIDDLEVRYGEQRDQASELRNALAIAGHEREQLSDLISRKESECAGLKAHLDEAVRHAERQENELQRLNRSFGEQTAQLTALAIQVAMGDAERSNLQQSIGQRDACIDELNGKLSFIDERLQSLFQNLDQQTDEVQVLHRELGEREQRIGGLEEQLGVHKDEVRTLRDALISIEGERDGLCEVVTRKEAEVADLSSRLNETVQQLASRETELVNTKTALSGQISKLEAVSELVRSLEADRSRLQAAAVARDAYVGEMMGKLSATDSHLEKLFDNLDNQGAEIQQLNQQLEARSGELRELESIGENYARNLHALIISALDKGIYLKPQNFDEAEYLVLNPDVKDAIEQGLFASGYEHWLLFGGYEKRQVCFQHCDVSPSLSKKGKISILDKTRAHSRNTLLNRLRRMMRPIKLAFSSGSGVS